MAKKTAACATTQPAASTTELTQGEFVLRAIAVLREEYRRANGKEIKRIHVIWSGFNDILKLQYPGVKPSDITKRLGDERIIGLCPAKGGAMIWDPKDLPLKPQLSPEEALKRISSLK